MRHVLEGRSAQLQQLREMIRKCAAADESVLIGGESGTGKELVANLIHERSSPGHRALDYDQLCAVSRATWAWPTPSCSAT